MSLEPEYIEEKEKALNGHITRELFPYLYDYYKDKCTSPLVNDYNKFSEYMGHYLSAPFINRNGQMFSPMDGLIRKLNDIFSHLDNKYNG